VFHPAAAEQGLCGGARLVAASGFTPRGLPGSPFVSRLGRLQSRPEADPAGGTVAFHEKRALGLTSLQPRVDSLAVFGTSYLAGGRNMRYHPVALIWVLALGACTTQIGGSPFNDLAANGQAGQEAQFFIADLQTAAKNLDAAVSAGELAKDDPAPPCLHAVLQRAGVEPAPGTATPKPFVAQIDGLISAGSVLYVRIQQGKAILEGSSTLPAACKTLVGQIVIDGATLARKAL
jgi:hypothetical protein